MEPTKVLMQEHRVIEQVLSCLLKLAEKAEAENKLDGQSARETLDFLRGYADKWHHCKEEDRLFPIMEQRGFSADEGPTCVMRIEHRQGREHIRLMDESINGAAEGGAKELERFVRNARSYVVLLRQHIEKEDHCLFPMADQALSQDDLQELARQFEEAERDAGGDESTTRFLSLADSLARRLGVAVVGR